MFNQRFNLSRVLATASLGLALLGAGSAQAVTSFSVLNGWVNNLGGGDEASPLNNTFTGSESGLRFNSWAAFFIPAGSYESATISMTPGSYGDLGPAVLGLFDVSTPFSSFLNTFQPGTDVYDDLGSGREYASGSFHTDPLTLTLNGRALADINAAAGAYFVIGFTNKTTNAQPIRTEAELGSGIYISGNGRGATPLQLELAPSVAAVPEPAEWLMLGAGLLLVGAAARRRARRDVGGDAMRPALAGLAGRAGSANSAGSASFAGRAQPVLAALAALTFGMVASLAAVPAAHAASIDFEGADPAFIFDGDTVQHGGYAFTGFYVGDPSDGGGLVGALIDGSDPFLCVDMTCPRNNTSHYLAGLNDGLLGMSAAAGTTFRLTAFDASAIGHDTLGDPFVSGVLWLTGTRADGTLLEEFYELTSPAFGFQHYLTSDAFGGSDFIAISIAAYSCDFQGDCNAFNSNQGQFALDNLTTAVAAVPEPATYALLGLGLALVGVAARRRVA